MHQTLKNEPAHLIGGYAGKGRQLDTNLNMHSLPLSSHNSTPVDFQTLPPGAHRLACPRCAKGERDTALSVRVDQDGGVFFCHRCQWRGAWRSGLRNEPPAVSRRRAVAAPDRITAAHTPLEWSPNAEVIWHRTEPLRGTLAESYLRSRGCLLPPDDGDLRFLPPRDDYPPALCARVTDAIDARPLTLHFTRLRHDGSGKAGTGRDKTLLAGHRKAGGVIRLWPDEAVTSGLAVAEGIESALAAAHDFQPVWACVDAGNLPKFPVLAGIDSLTLFADADAAGLTAARECAARWAAAGREVFIVQANERGLDVADVVAA
jgi:hypothetical protein